MVPLGSNYLESYAEGVRCGIKNVVAPSLLGLDPRDIKGKCSTCIFRKTRLKCFFLDSDFFFYDNFN